MPEKREVAAGMSLGHNASYARPGPLEAPCIRARANGSA